MTERDLVLEPDEAAALDAERRRLAARYDRWRAGLQYAEDDTERAAVHAELERIRREQRQVRDRIRQASPRLASVRYPEPLDLDGARTHQEPGTAVVAYSVGETRTQLFTLWPGGTFQVATVELGGDALADRVAQLRGLCATADSPLEVVRAAAASLFDELLAPAADAMEGADRLLVVPDGPLHLLPFAVLAERRGEGVRFLAERLPVSTVVSLTVHSELANARGSRSAAAVAVFADPHFDAGVQGYGLAPLPGSRSEARAVAALFGRRADVFLGAHATEARVRALDRATDVVHFATHVVLDQASPLDAAIALAPADRDNGLLQAWEVFESVRVDARLITLSGCETGTGTARAGEGLMGLARAFQYAGARAVLASLWRVDDRVTAAFMQRVYAALVDGARIDEALRAAQVEFLRGAELPAPAAEGLLASVSRWLAPDGPEPEVGRPDLAHPFYWAAFKVEGDGW
jgi:CHAT domain-containing protein